MRKVVFVATPCLSFAFASILVAAESYALVGSCGLPLHEFLIITAAVFIALVAVFSYIMFFAKRYDAQLHEPILPRGLLNSNTFQPPNQTNSRGGFDLALLVCCALVTMGWGIFGNVWIQSHGGNATVERCKAAAPALYNTAIAMKGVLVAVGIVITIFTLLCRIENLYDDVSENAPHLLSEMDERGGIVGQAKGSLV